MMKTVLAAVLLVMSVLLSGCVVNEGVYVPAYSNDYVFGIGYYGTRHGVHQGSHHR